MSDLVFDGVYKEINFDVDGIAGAPGKDGKSAYELAVEAGYTGTLEQWLAECHPETRVTSLDDTTLADTKVIEAVGNPVYVDDVAAYADFGIADTGWYVFARISAMPGVDASSAVVEGAAGVIPGDDHVDVAVRFEVASMSQPVKITWGGSTETFVFKATDLAIRNLDYRVTFYVYDIAPFAKWEYVPTTDTAFAASKYYWIKEDGMYVRANVTEGGAVPTVYYVDAYALTEDTTFVNGKTYYTVSDGVYTAATVTAGEEIPADTYYEHSYAITEDVTFAEGKAYYTKSGTTYSAAEVTAGESVPTVYYAHSKVTFEGMTRNITYVCNIPIDCPVTFMMPEIEDDTHGAWFEIRFRHTGSYSSTLIVPEGAKVATEHTQPETAGFNTVDLHYSSIDGVKLWRFLNTHSSVPA